MKPGQIIVALFILGFIGLAVYRGLIEPWMQKRKNRLNPPSGGKAAH